MYVAIRVADGLGRVVRAAAAHQTALDLVGRHVDENDVTQADAAGGEQLGLRHGSREPVEEEAVRAVGLRKSLGDDSGHQLVGHQSTGLHVLIGLLAQLGAIGDGLAQDGPGADVRDRTVGREALGLRALAGAGRTQENDVHRLSGNYPPPFMKPS